MKNPPTSDESVLLAVEGGVALVTLNRPHRRNALDTTVIRLLPEVVHEAAGRDDVRVIVLTGTDPAFCAGLDLHELGTTGGNLGLPDAAASRWPWDAPNTVVIGAINGPAVAGGLELALHCDFLVASERAVFADTHARVGQVPGAGLTVNLPRWIGQARAREMSFTGSFVPADMAMAWGLVNRVVPHQDLLPACMSIAAEITDNDEAAVAAIRRMYDQTETLPKSQALRWEETAARQWQAEHHDPAVVATRRERITARGRSMAAELRASQRP